MIVVLSSSKLLSFLCYHVVMTLTNDDVAIGKIIDNYFTMCVGLSVCHCHGLIAVNSCRVLVLVSCFEYGKRVRLIKNSMIFSVFFCELH